MGNFLRCSRAANSIVSGPIWTKFYSCRSYLQDKKDQIKINRETVKTSFSPLCQWGLSVAMETRSNLLQNLMQPFPHPSDATHKIWSRLANWLQRYSSLKVWTSMDGRRTIGIPLVYYKLTLWAFGSGELIKIENFTCNALWVINNWAATWQNQQNESVPSED